VGVPLVWNWSEMQPTGRRLDVASAAFKTARRALVRDFAFPSFSSPHACPLHSKFFRIRNAAAACSSSPSKTPPSRC
jgi:hypothetical protein